ncbi:hypothetical protein BGZ92_005839, partial [Podila epicladia]
MPPKRRSETALTRDRSRKLISSPSQYAKLSEMHYFFRDPPNVDSLINRVLPEVLIDQAPSLDTTATANGGDSDGEDETESGLTKFRGLQFNFSSSQRNTERNRPRVFLATQYLRNCLQTLVHGNKELHKVNITKNNKSIQILALQLNANDPEFKGVTAGALVSLYTKVVESKRCVESHLETSTSEAFIPTRFFDLAGELTAYDDDIIEAKESQRTTKDGR